MSLDDHDGLTIVMLRIGREYDNYNNKILAPLTNKYGPDWKSAQDTDGRSAVADAMENEMIQSNLCYVRKDKTTGVWKKVSDSERRTKLRGRLKYWTKKSIKASESSTSVSATSSVAESVAESTTASVSEESIESTTESEPFATGALENAMSRLSIAGKSINWQDSPVPQAQQRLDLLIDVMEGNPKAYKYLVQKARDSQDKSAAQINGAIQIFLDPINKGQAHAYKGLLQFYPPKQRGLFIAPEDIADLLKYFAEQKSPGLEDYTVTNPSILIGEGKRGPQPTHADTKQPVPGVKPEKFCILVLTKGGAPGTIYYITEDLPASPTIEHLAKLWPGAPPSLLEKIGDTSDAKELLRGYGQLLYATADKRVEPGKVSQYSGNILNGSQPHCAPPSVDGSKRSVVFFVLQPPDEGRNQQAAAAQVDHRQYTSDGEDDDEFYDGETQVSKEKLVFLLYDTLREHHKDEFKYEEKKFLLDKFAEFVKDSAQLGARDLTFDLPDKLMGCFDRLWHDADKAQAAGQALAEARQKSESADSKLASTMGDVVAAFQGYDYMDDVADENA